MDRIKTQTNAPWLQAMYIFTVRLLSGLLFSWLVFDSLSLSLFNFFFSVLFGLSAYFILNLVPSRIRPWVVGVLLFIMGLLFVSQLLYYQMFKTLYTIYSMMNGAQVAEFYKDIINLILQNWWAIILFFIPTVLFVVVYAKSEPVANGFQKSGLWSLVPIFVLWFGLIWLISTQTNGAPSVRALYHTESQPLQASSEFGLLTAMRIDFRNYFSPEPIEIDTDPVVVEPVIPIVKDPETMTETGVETITETPVETNVEPEAPRIPWTLDIDFDKLINSTNDKTLKQMDEYFSQVKPSYQNDYTGIAKDFNMIFITAEAYSRFSVDKELTPTLYMMQEKGLKFTNFYNPVWSVSTSDGEYVGVTGLIPKGGVWSLAKSGEQKNDLAFTYGNLLRRYGYHTMAFHNHTYSYYKRNISHPNMGYIYMGIGNGLDIRKTWPESDIDLMTETMHRYMDHEKFHTYYLTVSGHLGYKFSDNFIATKNRSLVEHLPYKTMEAKGYMATQIEFDRAMKLLIDTLREKGLAEKTLIVVNADHYPYGLPKASIDELAGEVVEEHFELYRGSLLVYYDGIKPATIEKLSSSLDILPTVYNLMGIPFDSRLVMGRDILSDTPGLVILVNRSWISDLGRYNTKTKKFTPNPGVEVPEGYVQTMNRLVNQRYNYSRLILEKDYYRHINKVAKWPELD